MWIRLLGPLQVRSDDGVTVNVGGPRPRSLLALLALNAGQVVGLQQLIDGLYGELPPDGAVNALQSQVSRLRRGLRAAGVTVPIEMHPAGYRLAADPEQVDVHRFTRLAREGQRALESGELSHAAALLREATGLWQGPALADVADAPFAAAQRAGLTAQRVAVQEDLAEAELGLGRHASVATELHEAVAEHPLRERLRALMMRALAGAGRQAEALAVFEDTRRVLADELGADPSAELAEAHMAVLRGDVRPKDGRSKAERSASRTRLPAPVSSFVGREEEIPRLGELLAEGRLVTLVGPGGVGKTRLALEVAERAMEQTVTEAWFVDLSVVRSGAAGASRDADEAAGDTGGASGGGVAEAVAGALGLRAAGPLTGGTRPEPDPADRLVAALSERDVLVVLDNCEHLVAEVAGLVLRLLGSCRRVRVLATSREALGITGEALWPLAPLEAPAADVTPARALEYAAVRLFVERAAAVRPGFGLGEAEVGPVLRICAALDGLPLALELAAARLRSLPLAEVEARLGDRFRLLGRGERTAAPRHRTLRAVVEWSWDLLDEEERTLARRLTVFVGGAPLGALARVCACDELDDPAEVAAGLVDKSLVEVDGSGRYRMLETVREFCAQRLTESGESERVEGAHAQWCLALVTEAEPYLRRPEQLRWLARLDAERPNIRAALHRSTHTAPDRALRLVALLSGYWFLRGLRREAAPPAAELLRTVGPRIPEGLEDEYVLCVLNARAQGGDSPELHAGWQRAVSVMHERTEPPRYPYLTLLWATAAGPTEASRDRPRTQVGTDPWSQALSRMGSGYQGMFAGETGEVVEREFEAALRGFRTVGDRLGAAEALDAVATLASRRGQHARSLALWDEGVVAARELGATAVAVTMRCHRGAALLRNEQLDEARAEFLWAESTARRDGLTEELASARWGLGEVARLDGDPEAARRVYERILADGAAPSASGAAARVRALVGLGRVAEAAGDVEEALARHREALDTALRGSDLDEAAGAVEGLAGAALLAGDGERAAFLLGLGQAVRGGGAGGAARDPDATRTTAGVRDLIGAERLDRSRRRGAAMTVQAALDELGVRQVAVGPGAR